MNGPRATGLGLAVLALLVTSLTTAKDDWHKVATLTAGGQAKEVTVNRDARTVRITAESGTVVVNTVVVREGAKTTPHPVTAKLTAKAHHDIDLGTKTRITGLRISDGDKGTYTVSVK
jgi:hypothetical protein